MHEETKNVLSDVIESNLRAIKNPGVKLAFLQDPSLPTRLMLENQEQIDFYVNRTSNVLTSLSPYLYKLKNNINDITAQTHIVAIYLLISSTFYEWDSFLNLASS